MSDYNRDENETEGEESSNSLAWFMTGAMIGATITMLYAPKSGRDTRQYLSDKTAQGKEAVAGKSKDVVDSSRELFERGRKIVDDAADLFDRAKKLVRG